VQPATGNRYRYRYYTCFSHQRYGKQACPSERLPADQLDEAILAALLDTFARTDLAEQATRLIRSQAADVRDRAEGELAVIRTEIDQAEAAIERYLGAFEAGTLPEAQCGKRLQALGAKIVDLQARELELQQALAASAVEALPTPADLVELASQVRQVIEHAPVAAKKTLAQQLVHEIHVTSRADIQPIFRVPTRNEPPPGDREKVRKLVGVGVTGLEPVTSSLYVMAGSPLCGPAFPQLTEDRKGKVMCSHGGSCPTTSQTHSRSESQFHGAPDVGRSLGQLHHFGSTSSPPGGLSPRWFGA
jgi:hypothetical protein